MIRAPSAQLPETGRHESLLRHAGEFPYPGQGAGLVHDSAGPNVVVSGAFQSIPGRNLGDSTTRQTQSSRPSLGRNLSGNIANVPVNLMVPGTMYGERLYQLDLRATKLFRFGRYRTRANFDVYNALNSDTVLTQNNNYAAWLRPTSILTARLFKDQRAVRFLGDIPEDAEGAEDAEVRMALVVGTQYVVSGFSRTVVKKTLSVVSGLSRTVVKNVVRSVRLKPDRNGTA